MGIGIVYGGVPGMFHDFNARNGRGGAEQLVQHPAIFRFVSGDFGVTEN